ncbi:MAG: hypothetical protein HWE39_07945 [Oceanospirillaceae bacterium]|nr:hypothetical protein [Oceanospirillaceae bacterium]
MPIDYAAILRENGFVAECDDLYDSLTGFGHEINDVLHDDGSPFDVEKSEIRRQPQDLNCLLYCSLVLKTGIQPDQGVRYLIDKWHSWLRYANPLYENIERTAKADGTSLRILTISRGRETACSIGFDITSPVEVAHEQV